MFLITKLFNASKNSWKGIKYAWQTQWAFRLELALLVIALPFVYLIGQSPIEYVLMMSSLIMLPMIELLNSAIETTVNRISYDYHPLSGLAKDLASAAIAFSGINVCIIWGVIILQHFY
jgi:diacylglycerol kinase (ATP)